MASKGGNMIRRRMATRRRRVVVDVDTQNHFFVGDSPMRVNDYLSVLDNVEKILTWARNEHIPMVSTVQVHSGSAVYGDSFPSGGFSMQKPARTLCRRRVQLEAGDCTDLPAKVVEKYDQVILQKRSFDPFAEPRCDRFLTEFKAEEFILVGVPTEGAVKATALGLLARGKRVIVVVDATGALSTRSARKALVQMKAKGARLVTTAMLIDAMQTVESTRYN